MWNLIFVSGDSKSRAEVKALLPEGTGLEEYATLWDLPRPAASGSGGFSGKVILVDLAGGMIPAGRLDPFHRLGVPVLAWLTAPAQREAALRAGFDDYLLSPCPPAELSLRIDHLLHRPESAGNLSPASLERERQAAVGRLTSYFCHAVNNSIQTIRGAVDLAREEPDVPAPIAEYLTICRKETVSIAAKIERLRQIYRPKPAPPESVALGALLHETLQMATDELLHANVTVREQFESGLPDLHGSTDRLALAFLMILFHFAEELGARGGGELRLRTERNRGSLQASFAVMPGAAGRPESEGGEPVALPAGLEPARELIQGERGRLEASPSGGGASLTVRFPVGGGG
jgi:hypothetical protein